MPVDDGTYYVVTICPSCLPGYPCLVCYNEYIPVSGTADGIIDYYTAVVLTANDYYPFGMGMPGRKYSADGAYRYGFNGKENDNEVKGEGNQQDYGMRIYDPRLGRFLSVDPLTIEYPWYTPYQFAGNKPIKFIDRDGEEEDDPDKRLSSAVPHIKQTFASNILKLPENQRVAMERNVNHAFWKRSQFNNYLTDRWLSTRLLTRWMEGKGGYDILSYKVISNSSYLSWLTFDRRRDAIAGQIGAQTLEFAKKQKAGQYTYSFFAQKDVRQGASTLSDIGTALGSYKIMGRGDSYIVKGENGEISITMTIYFTLADKYQWKKGKGIALEEFVDHDMMLELEKIGAKPFYIRMYFEATFKYENGEFKQISNYQDSKSSWYLNESGERGTLSNPEPDAGNGYAIPDSERHKVNDHRGEN